VYLLGSYHVLKIVEGDCDPIVKEEFDVYIFKQSGISKGFCEKLHACLEESHLLVDFCL
jgi:hypothetical protein